MKKKRTKAQLKKIMAAGYAARNELEDIAAEELNRKNAERINSCEKFHNSYGSGEKWWLYRRILAVNGSWCTAFSFQIKDGGQIEIELQKHSSLDSSSWIKITDAEFEQAYLDTLATIYKQHAHRGPVSEDER